MRLFHTVFEAMVFSMGRVEVWCNFTMNICIYEYIYIYTKFMMWCEDQERSTPLQVEPKQSIDARQRSAVSRRLAIFRQLTVQIYYKHI